MIGPKRRVFGRTDAKKLSLEEWETCLPQEGKQGGQKAMRIDCEEQKQNMREQHDFFGENKANLLEAFRNKVKKNEKTGSTRRANSHRMNAAPPATGPQNKEKSGQTRARQGRI